MDIRKLQRVVIDALEDVKAQNIKVFNTIGLSDMFDRVVLASGTSNRQTRALAYRVAQQVKEAGGHVVSVEGADAGEWVLVDLGDLVVHVMQPAIREYYSLEEIWGGKPVKMKLAETGARRIVAQASEDEPAPTRVEAEAPRKAARKAPVTRKAAPAKKATRSGATKATKAASRASPARAKTAAKKSAPRKAVKTARKKARA
jgi:ribosome-associated protein